MFEKFLWMMGIGTHGNHHRMTGTSSGSGFELSWGNGVWKTRRYTPVDPNALAACNALLYALRAAALGAAIAATGDLPLLGRLFAVTSLWLTLSKVARIVYGSHVLKSSQPLIAEYHAAEHRTVCLLEEGLQPTRENFRRCPKVSVRCGTSWAVRFAWTILGPVSTIIAEAWGVLFVLLLAMAAYACLSLCMAARVRHRRLLGILAISSLPLILPGLVVERLCIIREPRPEIVDEALELARRFQDER